METTLHPMEVAKRAFSNNGGGGGALEERVETLETKIAGLEEYSTLEVNTGKEWIDGRPIYRKIIPFKEAGQTVTLEPNEWKQLNFPDTAHYECIVDAKGWYAPQNAFKTWETLPVGIRILSGNPSTLEGIAPLQFRLDYLMVEYCK